jgi:osmotically-inducible protein OsmY
MRRFEKTLRPGGAMLADFQPTRSDTPTPYRPHTADDRIVHAALTALEREHIVPEGRFAINVDHGWATLEGHAAHFAERSAAECIVRYVPGVEGVTNRLEVARGRR